MRILLLSFYHPPDLSAGSFRAAALVAALSKRLPEGGRIDVLTTLPNRYASYQAAAPRTETDGPVTIHRFALPPHQSGIVDQSRSFAAYATAVLSRIRGEQYDIIVATSSRLMTAALAAGISRIKRAPLYLDIRDIFIDTIGDLFPGRISQLSIGPFSLVERFAFNRASTINLVSPGFEPYFRSRYKNKRLTFHTNGIDEEFENLQLAPPPNDQRATVLYAGNIGEGQGLHKVLPQLALKLRDRVRFRVLGDGGRISQLRQSLAAAGVDNVDIAPPVARAELISEYAKADVLFLHLNDVEAFKKVLPSKLFEYAATGRPIWAGMNGYAAQFSAAEIRNAATFDPCNVPQALAAFARLSHANTDRSEFIGKYARTAIMARMADDIMKLVNQPNPVEYMSAPSP